MRNSFYTSLGFIYRMPLLGLTISVKIAHVQMIKSTLGIYAMALPCPYDNSVLFLQTKLNPFVTFPDTFDISWYLFTSTELWLHLLLHY